MEALAPLMGIPPVLNGPVADLTRSLSGAGRRDALRAITALHLRFPQISFAAVLMDIPDQVPPAVQAFWLFNKGSLFSSVEKGGDNHGVLLLVDPSRQHAVAMVGYGLEPFVSEMILEVCLSAATGNLAKDHPGHAIGAFARELERQLLPIVEKLPRTFGYTDDALWSDGTPAAAAAISAPFGGDDVY